MKPLQEVLISGEFHQLGLELIYMKYCVSQYPFSLLFLMMESLKFSLAGLPCGQYSFSLEHYSCIDTQLAW